MRVTHDVRRRPRGTAWTELAADELPTMLRRSSPREAVPTVIREPLPSLASILEPRPVLPFLRSRPALVPPNPHWFRMRRFGWLTPSRTRELRWVARIALLGFVIVGELAIADTSGALHRPRDVADAGSMITSAAYASVVDALAR